MRREDGLFVLVKANRRSSAVGAFALALGVLLPGCLVMPQGTRLLTPTGLDDGMPTFVVPLRTTRGQLRAELGPATGVSADGLQICYRAMYDTSGFVIVTQSEIGGPIVLEIRRLVLDLDTQGVVERATYDKVVCRRPFAAWSCVDSAGQKLTTDPTKPQDALPCVGRPET